MEQCWLSINFTMPKEPSRVRVSIWRKLKRSGAANIGQSIWVLPSSEEHVILFKEIASLVKENSGQTFIMKTDFLQGHEDKPITNYFNDSRDEEYREFLGKCEDFHKEIEKETAISNFSFAEIEENEHEITKLNTWLDGILKRDFFHSSLREQSINTLSNCRDAFDTYCNLVYEKNNTINT